MTPVKLPDLPKGHLIMSASAFYGMYSSCKWDNVLTISDTLVGHIKPMVDLAVKIEKLQPTIVTLLVADTLFDAIDRELRKQLNLHVQKDRRKYIRYVTNNTTNIGCSCNMNNDACIGSPVSNATNRRLTLRSSTNLSRRLTNPS